MRATYREQQKAMSHTAFSDRLDPRPSSLDAAVELA
jgi:hypothetical protein